MLGDMRGWFRRCFVCFGNCLLFCRERLRWLRCWGRRILGLGRFWGGFRGSGNGKGLKMGKYIWELRGFDVWLVFLKVVLIVFFF